MIPFSPTAELMTIHKGIRSTGNHTNILDRATIGVKLRASVIIIVVL